MDVFLSGGLSNEAFLEKPLYEERITKKDFYKLPRFKKDVGNINGGVALIIICALIPFLGSHL